jgi:hypothetical protein
MTSVRPALERACATARASAFRRASAGRSALAGPSHRANTRRRAAHRRLPVGRTKSRIAAAFTAAATALGIVVILHAPSSAEAATSAVNWPSGAFLGSGANTAAAKSFASWRGDAMSVAEIYAPRDSWSNLANDTYLIKQYAGFSGRLSVGVPLTVGSTSLQSVADGKADSYFTSLALNLKALGRGDSDLRLGWEFNGNWYAWSATTTSTYLAAFRHVSRVLKTTLPSATIDWDGNWGNSQSGHDPFTEEYPGDTYVDVVGLDAYDGGWVAANTDANFVTWKNSHHSLKDWYEFAVAHGKKFAMAEWGLVANGEKDNPTFIRGMYSFFQRNAAHIAYEAYFNSYGSSLYNPNEYPNSSATYQQLWSQTS